jgi:hypothetical protein
MERRMVEERERKKEKREERKYDEKFNLTKYCSLKPKKENLYLEQNTADSPS